jgi:hypothetical protein
MTGAARWRDNWRAVSPPGAVRVELGRSGAAAREAERAVRAMPAGAPVVLAAAGLGSARRCRRLARRTGLVLEREFLAVPSVTAPAYLVEAERGPIDVFLTTVLVTPPGAPLAHAVDAVLGLVRALRPVRVMRALAPGRVVVGRCA